jgi:hypothetical protein
MDGMEPEKPKKLSTTFKVLCYAGINFGTIFFAFAALVDGGSLRKALFIMIGNLVFWNSFLWYGFGQRDKASQGHKPQ